MAVVAARGGRRLDCVTGAMRISYVSHGAPDLQVGELKTSDARAHERQERETLRRAVMGKSSSAQDGHHVIQGRRPLAALH